MSHEGVRFKLGQQGLLFHDPLFLSLGHLVCNQYGLPLDWLWRACPERVEGSVEYHESSACLQCFDKAKRSFAPDLVPVQQQARDLGSVKGQEVRNELRPSISDIVLGKVQNLHTKAFFHAFTNESATSVAHLIAFKIQELKSSHWVHEFFLDSFVGL